MLHGIAQALHGLRVGFLVNGAGAILSFIAAYVFHLVSPSPVLRQGRTTPALTLQVKR
jgi:hypothetical protein